MSSKSSSSSSSSSFLESVDALIESKSLLNHPFYRMWSKGELTKDQLAGYSREYFSLVKAVPDLVSSIEAKSPAAKMKRAISENLSEERSHIAMWMRFASSLGVSMDDLKSFDPAIKTKRAVAELQKLSKLSSEEAISSMYAYESVLPKISRTKREGLKEFYGLDSKDATTYFDVHEKVDVRHASLWREYMRSIPEERRPAALRAISRSMDAQNLLLDSVMDRYVNK